LAEVIVYWSEYNENSLEHGAVSELNKHLSPDFHLDYNNSKKPQRLSFFAKMMLSNILEKDFLIEQPLSTFKKDMHGKPSIDRQDLYFNISHSKNLVSIAVCKKASIGIDVQLIKSFSPGVAKRVFHDIETKEYNASKEQQNYFFNTWSKKEASVKATGFGIKTGLTTFSVTEKTLQLNNQELHLAQLKIKEGYSAAIAVNHPISNIIIKKFDLI